MSDELGTLKPGDEVVRYYQEAYSCDNRYEFHRVARVMPSGRIVLENGMRFKPDGKQVGQESYCNGFRIKVATDELREEIRRKDLFYRLRPTLDVWIRLPTATLERIAAVLEDEKEGENNKRLLPVAERLSTAVYRNLHDIIAGDPVSEDQRDEIYVAMRDLSMLIAEIKGTPIYRLQNAAETEEGRS